MVALSFATSKSTASLKKHYFYPEVSICSLQYVPHDSLAIADSLQLSLPGRWTLQMSHFAQHNDTVTITGVCIVPAKTITYTAKGYTMLVCDSSSTGIAKPWCGILVRVNTVDSSQAVLDGFMNVQRGDVVRMTGRISEFPTNSMNSTTQFQPIPGIPVEIVGSAPVPGHISVTACDFYQGLFPNGKAIYTTGEQYEGVLVELTHLTVGAIVNSSRGTFYMIDESGNCSISDYDASHFFTIGHENPIIPGDPFYVDSIWPKIQVGTFIDTIRGFISTASGQENQRGYRICPLLPGDLVIGKRVTLVNTHRRYPVVVTSDSSARVTCVVKEGSFPVANVKLKYRLNNSGDYQNLSMSPTDDTTYQATIPQQSLNTFVNYFIEAADDSGNVTTYASSATDGTQLDTSHGFFFYKVKSNSTLSVFDVQYTPYVNGRSGYVGGIATVSGFVTADTANIMLTPRTTGGASSWFIQDSSSAWNGMWVVGAESLLAQVNNNDNISVTGTIQESGDVTRLANVTNVIINSTGNPKRIPIKLNTGRFGPSVGNGNPNAEKYEGVLVQFDSVTITNISPTASDITEFEVDDGTGPILVRRDGRNTFSNVQGDTIFGSTILHQGDKIHNFVGIVYFGNRRYKVCPRTNSDFIDVTGIIEKTNELPSAFSLKQNYPNPFNPTTKFSYELPVDGFTTLQVFNVIGQEVVTIVNEFQTVGKYSVSFDATKLSSGIYFYRLRSGSFIDTKKMVLLK